MGRLPEFWAGRKITARVPYAMAGELNVTSAQTGASFPNAVFYYNVDKPFEIHRLKPYVSPLDSQGNVMDDAWDQDTLLSLLKAKIHDSGVNQDVTKGPTPLPLLVKGSSERTWEWAEPRTIVRAQGYDITIDAYDFTNFTDLVTLRLGWTFQGFQLVVAPASESR